MMSWDARIVVLPPGGKELEIQSLTLSEPAPYEVVVELHASGICHSQLNSIAMADPDTPLVLGHEGFGIVAAIGDQVHHVRPGDPVFVTFVSRNLAREPSSQSLQLADGARPVGPSNVFTWATHTRVDEQFVVKAPADMPADLGSIIGCAVMTGAGTVVNVAKVAAGESVAVWGAGGVGLSSIGAARAVGAQPVIAIDIDDAKLELARKLGADITVNAAKDDPVERVRALAGSATGPAGVDYSLDSTGRADTFAQCYAAVRPGVPGGRTGGSAVLLSNFWGTLDISAIDLVVTQKQVVGSRAGACSPDRDFPTFVDWFNTGQLDLAALVTDRYPLDQVNNAVEDLRAGKILGRGALVLQP